MPVTARQCLSCGATLADEASFCHKCGASTPHSIDRATGEIVRPSGDVDPAHRARLQRALGDNYEVRRLLGRGGFAEVYVAYDKRLKREIAVKTIRSDIVSSEALRRRFQSEAEAVAALRHPNVVPIYSVGEGDDLAYFTMPLIEGESLAQSLQREGKLPVADACRIVREAAQALHAAHRAGIVHRDVKPENIMLEGPERSVVMMDFGIAKSAAAEGKGVTATGMLVGTPEYMSPEQAMGERTVDHRSDQYSLALIAYRMLSGKLPFESESLQTRLFKVVTEVPAPLIELSSEVPRPISDAVAKALSKSPSDRFESIAAFAKAVDIAPAAEPSPAASRRRPLAMAARIEAMRSVVRAARVWLAIAGVALVAGIWLEMRSMPVAALGIAAARPDAEFAARQFLAKRLAENRSTSYTRFVAADTVQRVLQRAIGFDSLQARAQRDIPVWGWAITFPSRDRRDNWVVHVGPNNRVTGFLHVLNDSAAGAALTADSARALAARELPGQGWDATTLELVRDSTITRRARTDHELTWRTKRGEVPLGSRDTASLGMRITVSGGSVSGYEEQFLIPDSVSASLTASMTSASSILGVGAILLVLLVIVVVIRRQRVDTPQWSSMVRIAVAVVSVQLAGEFFTLLRNHGSAAAWTLAGSWLPSLAALAGMLFLAGALTVIGAAAESLAVEQRPATVGGFDEVSRAHIVVPEIVPGAIHGYAIGSVMLLVWGLSDLATGPLGIGLPRSVGLTSAFSAAPILTQLGESLLTTSFGAFGALLAAALMAKIRRAPAWAVPIAPATVFALAFIVAGNLNTAPAAFLVALLAGYAVWRFGVITGVIALGWCTIVLNALPLIMADLTVYKLSGVFLSLVALLPVAAALRSWRRFGSTTPA